MTADVAVVMTWVLFLSLFPCSFFWLRRAWRIFVRKNYAEVAVKNGKSPDNPAKWAPFVGLLNLLCGGIAVWIILAVLCWGFFGLVLGITPDFKTWNAYGGLTICGKLMADFIIRLQAHPFIFKKKGKVAEA